MFDDLETSPDSGVLKSEFQTVRNTASDDKPDFVDAKSNGVEFDFDLYLIDRVDLDQFGLEFISPILDVDIDGIMDEIDTDTGTRGAPGSAYSPQSS